MPQARASASRSLLLEAQDSVVQLRSQAKPKHSGSLGCAEGKSGIVTSMISSTKKSASSKPAVGNYLLYVPPAVVGFALIFR